MALECYCIPLKDLRVLEAKRARHAPKSCTDTRRPELAVVDLCEVQRRTQDTRNRHNDRACHQEGERRQNLINKMKMFLNDVDDRPVMNRGLKAAEEGGRALGQTGFGPLIKYPGYVDYDHPYFSEPYNRMPTLALTSNPRGGNPCPPVSVRNWDETRPHQVKSQEGVARVIGTRDKGCHCARRRGEDPQCPAARL